MYFAPGLHFINSRGDMFLKRMNISAGILIYNSRAETASSNDMPWHIITKNYLRAYIQRRTENFRGCLQTPVLGFGTKP